MKTTLRFHFIPSRMASIKILLLQQLIIIIIKSDIKSEYESRKKKNLLIFDKNANGYNHYGNKNESLAKRWIQYEI